MATGNRKKIDEAQIREPIDRWLKALRAKNLDGIMSCYTPDILLFDLLPPLQYLGADAYREGCADHKDNGLAGYRPFSRLQIRPSLSARRYRSSAHARCGGADT